MNAQIANIWNTAQFHPDEESRRQAFSQLQSATMKTYRKLQDWQRSLAVDAPTNMHKMEQSTHVAAYHDIPNQEYFLASQRSQPRTPEFIPHEYRSPSQPSGYQLAQDVKVEHPQSVKTEHQTPPQNHVPLETHDMPQSQNNIPEQLRTFIHANLGTLMNAIRILNVPNDLSDLNATAGKQNAELWLNQFKAQLPPEGHAYMQHLCENMFAVKEESRD
jgi:hypothetical protein